MKNTLPEALEEAALIMTSVAIAGMKKYAAQGNFLKMKNMTTLLKTANEINHSLRCEDSRMREVAQKILMVLCSPTTSLGREELIRAAGLQKAITYVDAAIKKLEASGDITARTIHRSGRVLFQRSGEKNNGSTCRTGTDNSL